MNQWEELFKKNDKSSNLKIKSILKKLGFKQTFKIFNVVGTNGKGSVSSYLVQGFQKKIKKVGLFQSPHIKIANERISINGQLISNNVFFEIYNQFKNKKVGFFSSLFIVAMVYFMKQKCNVVILEAGIGGKKDVTNLFLGTWGVVTSIGLDHTNILGSSKKDIALDKAQIMNKNMNFYLPSSLKKEHQNIFRKIAKKRKSQIINVNNQGSNYQKRNMKLAQKILKDCVGINMQKFNTPKGRTEVFNHKNLTTIFDVAHNIDGIQNSLQYLKEKKINFEQVVLTLVKSKIISKKKPLFKNKTVVVWQPSDKFYSGLDLGKKEIDNIQLFYDNQQKTTLYIGSFKLIGSINE